MKKYFFTLVLIFMISVNSNAQKLDKIKGNRIVSNVITEVSPFHTIIVDEDFEVNIIYNKTPTVEIKTDENLHEYISFKVKDSILSFDKKARITSKKELSIKVSYNDFLSNIETKDNGEILSLATMEITNGSLKTNGNSKASLTVNTNNFYFEGLDKSKVKLNLSCDSTKIVLNGNSKFEALINAPKIHADLYQRANAVIEGSSDDIKIRTDNNSRFLGENLTTKTAIVFADISSDITLEMTDSITIEASGSSSINIYGEPKIIVNKLSNTSKIQKKEK